MEGSFDLGYSDPDDIMDDICFRLSAVDLWQCRELGSCWRRRIRNQLVVNRHTAATKNNVCLIFHLVYDFPISPVAHFGLYRNDGSACQRISKFKAHSSFKKRHAAEIVGVCHDLVCTIYEGIGGSWYFGISNPSTKQIIRTVFPLEEDDAGIWRFSFGYNPFDNIAYILIIWEDLITNENIRCIQFSTYDKLWVHVEPPNFGFNIWSCHSVCNNGIIYWKSKVPVDSSNGQEFLLSYCPRTQHFDSSYLPDIPVGLNCRLIDFDGYVAIFNTERSSNNSNDVTVWIYDNTNGNSSAWSRYYIIASIPLSTRILGFMQQTLVGVKKDGAIDAVFDIFHVNRVILDLFFTDGTRSEREVLLPKDGPISIAAIYQYSGSLIEI